MHIKTSIKLYIKRLKLTSGMHPEAYIGVIFKVKACESIAS
jgi:hypothetical protein